MKNMFKNLNIGGLLALVAGVVLMVSWKNSESVKTATEQWYEVSIIDENQDLNSRSNQKIEGFYPGGTPSNPCSESSGRICAIRMTTDLPLEELPETVQDAQSHPDISVGQSVYFELD